MLEQEKRTMRTRTSMSPSRWRLLVCWLELWSVCSVIDITTRETMTEPSTLVSHFYPCSFFLPMVIWSFLFSAVTDEMLPIKCVIICDNMLNFLAYLVRVSCMADNQHNKGNIGIVRIMRHHQITLNFHSHSS